MTHQGGKKGIRVENNFAQTKDQERNPAGRKGAEIHLKDFFFSCIVSVFREFRESNREE
jgi:hypothetical protein